MFLKVPISHFVFPDPMHNVRFDVHLILNYVFFSIVVVQRCDYKARKTNILRQIKLRSKQFKLDDKALMFNSFHKLFITKYHLIFSLFFF